MFHAVDFALAPMDFPISRSGEVSRVLLDPTGFHALMTNSGGETWYLNFDCALLEIPTGPLKKGFQVQPGAEPPPFCPRLVFVLVFRVPLLNSTKPKRAPFFQTFFGFWVFAWVRARWTSQISSFAYPVAQWVASFSLFFGEGFRFL